MQPHKGWTPENIERMARYLAENYYIDEDGNQQPRRSDEDAYEEWKMCAASLGVPRTGQMEYPDEVTKRAEAIREEMDKTERLSAGASEFVAVLREWMDYDRGEPTLARKERTEAVLRKYGAVE